MSLYLVGSGDAGMGFPRNLAELQNRGWGRMVRYRALRKGGGKVKRRWAARVVHLRKGGEKVKRRWAASGPRLFLVQNEQRTQIPTSNCVKHATDTAGPDTFVKQM